MQSKWLERTKKYEGMRLKMYKCPAGKWTIGAGHNIEDNGIPLEIAEALLKYDLELAEKEVSSRFAWYQKLNSARKYVMCDLAFNMGISRLLTFKKMLAALKEGFWERAAHEALDSKWAKQVGRRAKELAEIIRTGEM